MYDAYVKILKSELVPALGCTEPIAIAYCAAKAMEILVEKPNTATIYASGNIIKNVKSVVVPNTGGLKGIEVACAAGIFYGDVSKNLQVISGATKEQIEQLPSNMEGLNFEVQAMETEHVLDIVVELKSDYHTSRVRIMDAHTNIVQVCYDGKILEEIVNFKESSIIIKDDEEQDLDYSILTIDGILDMARNCQVLKYQAILERQIEYNTAIADAGLNGHYGANIGQILLKRDDSVQNRAKAYAAAGSDARMSGCELPVIINSGSGNQGMTASLPVIVYAKEYLKSHEELLRALLVSNLVTLHLKSGIGKLSAYCGAVSAGVGAAAGISFLLTKNDKVVKHTIVNALAVNSGIVCDGAKASCAAKVAMSVEAGILGFEMYMNGSQFRAGDGLVSKGVENTIENISKLGHDGMKETDKKIIEIMTKQNK